MQTTRDALDQYSATDAYGSVEGADRNALVLAMMSGALDRIGLAKSAMERGDIAQKGEEIRRTMALLDALRDCLDIAAGGQIAENLDSLYEYMGRQLALANVRNDTAALAEVASLVREIRTGWEGMMATSSEQQPMPATP